MILFTQEFYLLNLYSRVQNRQVGVRKKTSNLLIKESDTTSGHAIGKKDFKSKQ
jgi:hypothetical protein